MKLRFITGRSQRQVPIFQWQGIGPARTGRSAAPDNSKLHAMAGSGIATAKSRDLADMQKRIVHKMTN